MADLIAPRRDERLIQGDRASQRYIKFFEELSDTTNLLGVPLSITVTVSTGTYTTIGNATIICTGSATIVLNASPVDKETVIVNSNNGDVTVQGNGRLINGESEMIQHIDYTSIGYFYSSALAAWFII